MKNESKSNANKGKFENEVNTLMNSKIKPKNCLNKMFRVFFW